MTQYDFETQQHLQNSIKEFVATSLHNSLGLESGEPAFDAPLIGFSNGADPLYIEYRNHIGSFYFTPVDMFAEVFSDTDVHYMR